MLGPPTDDATNGFSVGQRSRAAATIASTKACGAGGGPLGVRHRPVSGPSATARSPRAVIPSLGKIRCRYVLTALSRVGEPFGSQLSDAQLGRGQLVRAVRVRRGACFAGRT